MTIEVKNSAKGIDYIKSIKILEERVNDVFLEQINENLGKSVTYLNVQRKCSSP